jgi:hypothetical protein
MSSNVAPNIARNGLVLNLDAANQKSYPGSGTGWNDLTGNGNNGILTNGPTFNSANGGSIVFDGVDDYVNLSDISNYTNNFTINCWIKINNSGLNVIISKWDTVYTSNRFFLFRVNNNILQFYDSNTTLYAGGSISSNIWTNTSFIINGSNSQLYINGSPSGNQFTPTLILRSGLNLALGSYSVSLNSFFNGNIANSQIYNRALTSTEVLQNYNAQKSRFNL